MTTPTMMATSSPMPRAISRTAPQLLNPDATYIVNRTRMITVLISLR